MNLEKTNPRELQVLERPDGYRIKIKPPGQGGWREGKNVVDAALALRGLREFKAGGVKVMAYAVRVIDGEERQAFVDESFLVPLVKES